MKYIRLVTSRGARRKIAVLLATIALCVSCSAAVEIPADVAATPPVPTRSPAEAAVSDATPTETQEASSPTPAPEPEAAAGGFGFPVSSDWPESFREYVDFVQETRGEQFAEVADVRFADPDDLAAEYQSEFFSFEDLDADSQSIVLRLDDMYRALGLANTEFNILDANRAVAGDIAAFYDWQQRELVFPSGGGEYLDDIPLQDRPLLVHELGHALQAADRISWSDQIEDPALSTAILEGEAEWLFDQYLLSLSDTEWQAWNDSLPVQPDLPDDLPEILQIEFASSYVLGARFFHARYAVDGLNGIDNVFASEPNAVSAQMLLDPWRFTGEDAGQESFNYELPASRSAGTFVDIAYDFQTSAVSWHQILAAALPGDVALTAARGINSFTLPTGWIGIDDRLCFAIEVSASDGSEELVHDALETWSEVEGVKRFFDATDRGFYVGGCDPGPGNVPVPRATPGEVLGEVAYVLDTETWAVDQGLDPQAGFCAAWDLVVMLENSPEDQLDDVYYAWFDALEPDELTTDC